MQSENAFSVLLEQLGYALLFNHDELQSVNSLLKELLNGRTSATYGGVTAETQGQRLFNHAVPCAPCLYVYIKKNHPDF